MRKRKPAPFHLDGEDVYAGFDDRKEKIFAVYIGGSYYQSSAQIHLTKEEVIKLSKWLNKAAEYLKERS